ncbi:SEC20 [Phaffia rhodozyma]|uniref:SEC20 n=1 Tax=Phaffia rhodozyma TaxID=264483 RepID=A0A0F7SLW6_PHARH|nr:SEC20 [Phaffia rhodozyma]
MAPLPPSESPVILKIERLLNDVSVHQIPLLKSCTGPYNRHQELAKEIRGDLVRIERLLVTLEEEADDQDSERARLVVRSIFDQLSRKLDSARIEYRSALLTSKKSIDSNPAAIREELLYSKNRSAESTQADDPLQEKANQVTVALRQTTEMMKDEIDRSVLSAQLLDESTATLRSTTNLYETYSSLLQASSSLLTALEQANYTDRILIIAAVLFFLLVCGYILKKRVLDKAVGGLTYIIGGPGGAAKKAAKSAAKDVVQPTIGKILNQGTSSVLEKASTSTTPLSSQVTSVLAQTVVLTTATTNIISPASTSSASSSLPEQGQLLEEEREMLHEDYTEESRVGHRDEL